MKTKQLRARAKKFCGCPTYEAVGIREKCVVCQLVDNVDRLEREWERECTDGDAVLRALGLDPQDYRTDGGSLHLPKIREYLSAQKRAIELMRMGEATLLGEANEALAAECESLRSRLADSERLREDERLTWDAQHKRQASMNAHLAALVTDAQEELRKCQQDAIQLQDRLAEAEALREDAQRYRWLVGQNDPIIWDYLGGMDDDQIDEAIDKWIADDAHLSRKEQP